MTVLPDESGLAYTMARKRDPYAGQRSFAQKLLAQGTDTSPIQSPWQGVGRLAQALVGSYGLYKADADEKEAGATLAAKIAEAGKIADPTARMSAFAAIDPEIGLKYAAQSTAQEAATKRQRDDDLQAASFLIPGGTMQAGGAPAGGGVNPYNIGNVRPNGQSTGFQQPATPEDGVRLAVNNARAYPAAFNGGQPMTLLQIGERWAPKGDGANDPAQWARNVASIGGLPVDQPLDLNNPQVAALFARGVHGAEHGANKVQPPAFYAQAIAGSAPPGIAQGDNTGGNGSGVPVQQPGANFPQQGDPGAQYEAAARRAHEAGRGDIAIKYMQQATAAREAAQLRDANRTLQHVDLGDSIGILDPRSGQIVQRIPKGQKPGAGEGGAFGGTGMENQARSALVRAAQDPAFAASPAYAAAHGFLSRPRQVLDEARGVMVTLPPEDLSRFPAPSYQANGQPQGAPPQTMQPGPQAGGSLDYGPAPSGMPPAPSPAGVSGPVMQAPPAAGPTVTPMQGLPPKALTESQAKAYGFSQRMATANTLLDELAIQGTSKMGRFLEALPGGVGNLAQSPEYQRFEQAKRNFMNAQLRDESGAVIGPSEFMSADKQYFPQPGQETNKELIAQMAENRRQVIEAMLVKAGQLKPGERYVPPKAEPAAPQPQAAQSGPQEGATATNPQTGQKIIFRGGQWGPLQ